MALAQNIAVNQERLWQRLAFAAHSFRSRRHRRLRRAAEAAGYAYRDITSGAGHDAGHISRVAPTAMIFVPCAGGIGHNEVESATPEDLAAGCTMLLRAMLERAAAG